MSSSLTSTIDHISPWTFNIIATLHSPFSVVFFLSLFCSLKASYSHSTQLNLKLFPMNTPKCITECNVREYLEDVWKWLNLHCKWVKCNLKLKCNLYIVNVKKEESINKKEEKKKKKNYSVTLSVGWALKLNVRQVWRFKFLLKFLPLIKTPKCLNVKWSQKIISNNSKKN